jgi:hypothetical protein
MDKNKRQREWEDALNLMTEEELQFIREHPVGYYQNFVKMATKKAWEIIDDPYPIPENEAVKNAILHILGEMGCQCEIDEDDEIFFCCQGAEFSIRFDEEFEYIKIVDNSWKKVNLNDSEAVLKMTLAINRANIWNNVTIVYIIDKEEEVLDIFSSSSIPYFPNMTYLKKFLHNKLVEMLSSHDLVNRFLQEEKEFAINESFSQIQSHEAN